MPNTKLKNLYQLYQEESPDIISGMDENSFIEKFSNKEKLDKLFDLTNEYDKDLLGGMSKEDFSNKFIPDQGNLNSIFGVENFKNQSDPRPGISSPEAIKASQKSKSSLSSDENLNPYIDQDAMIKQDQTQVNNRIDAVIKPMHGREFTKDDDVIDVGASYIRNLKERKDEGYKENPERTDFNIYSEAIGNVESQVNTNLDIVKHTFSNLYLDKYENDDKKALGAFDDFMDDFSRLTKILDKENPENALTNEYIQKAQESFNAKWDKALKNDNVNKYLWGTLDIASKIPDAKNEIKSITPNYQKYLREIESRQAKEDKINYSNPINWERSLSNKLSRVAIGSTLEDLGAALETYLGVGYGLRESGRKLQERNPSATRFQRDMVEDYVPDDKLGIDYAIDSKGNFEYAVDQKTGNKIDVTNIPDSDLKKAFNDKSFKTRRNWGSIISQGIDEAYQELPGIAITVMSDGIASGLARSIAASKYAGSANKALKVIEGATSLSPKTMKKIASGAVEFASGSVEGTADARDQALKMGLSGDEAISWIAANQAATGLFDAINPAEIRWRNTEGGKFIKKLTEKYASGKITKLDLLKESGAQSLIDIAKNQATEFVGEAAGESIVRNKLHDVTDAITGVNTADSREKIDARSVETAFWGSLLASGTFGAASGIKLSKSGLMRDAIDYAIKNPEAFEGYYNGLQTATGHGLERAEFFKSTIEQVKEAGLSDKNKAIAAALIFDRQNGSLQIEELSKKYGADAPIVKRAQKELSDIEIKIDDLFDGKEIQDTEPEAQAATSAGGKFATDKKGASNDDSGAPLLGNKEINTNGSKGEMDGTSISNGTSQAKTDEGKKDNQGPTENRTSKIREGDPGIGNGDGPTILNKDSQSTGKEAVEVLGKPVSQAGFNYKPNNKLTDEEKQIETRFGKFISDNEDQLFDEYVSRFGHIVNTDNVRELSEDYAGNRNKLSNAVHEPASAFAKRIYEKLLDRKDINKVIFTSGGTGAGKSTGNINGGDALVYDGNLNGLNSSVDKIEQALSKGKEIEIKYTYREPIEAFENGVIPRATRRRDQIGGGRTVPINEHIKTHIGAFETIQKLYEKYKDNPNVKFKFNDNSYGKGNSQEISFGDLQKKSYLSDHEYRQKIQERAVQALAQGRIRQTEYEGFIGDESSFPRGAINRGMDGNIKPNDVGKTEQSGEPRQDNLSTTKIVDNSTKDENRSNDSNDTEKQNQESKTSKSKGLTGGRAGSQKISRVNQGAKQDQGKTIASNNWADTSFDPFSDNNLFDISEENTNFAKNGTEEISRRDESKQDSGRVGGFSENSRLSKEGIGQKTRRIVKGTRKSRRRIKDPRYRRALEHVISNAYDYVMQAFVSGDKINSEILRKHYKKSGGEIKARIGLINNTTGYKTVDQFVHSLWENQPEHTSFDTSELRDALEAVINDHVGTSKMVESLNQSYDVDQKELTEEQKRYEEIIDQTKNNSTPEEFGEVADIYEETENLADINNLSEEELDKKFETKYIPTQQEIEDGVYDEEGNFILFQKNDYGDDSNEESEHIKKCG